MAMNGVAVTDLKAEMGRWDITQTELAEELKVGQTRVSFVLADALTVRKNWMDAVEAIAARKRERAAVEAA